MEEKDSSSDKIFIARSRHDAPEVDGVVFLRSDRSLRPGTLVSCRVTGAYEYDLVAEELK